MCLLSETSHNVVLKRKDCQRPTGVKLNEKQVSCESTIKKKCQNFAHRQKMLLVLTASSQLSIHQQDVRNRDQISYKLLSLGIRGVFFGYKFCCSHRFVMQNSPKYSLKGFYGNSAGDTYIPTHSIRLICLATVLWTRKGRPEPLPDVHEWSSRSWKQMRASC